MSSKQPDTVQNPEDETPEEKKQRKLEAKKQAKVEKKRRAEQKAFVEQQKLLRLQLEREQKFTALTYEKSSKNWADMMLKIKSKELKTEMEVQMIILNDLL